MPLEYRGITFRSALEADWAATFDTLGIFWQYEPMALKLPSGQYYLPDFFLPNIHCWCEVKGPHWERIDKAVELRDTLAIDWPGCWTHVHVMVLEAAGPGDAASWRAPGDGQRTWLTDCGECGLWGFVFDDSECWRCGSRGGGDYPLYWPAATAGDSRPTLTMTRAPRPQIGLGKSKNKRGK